MEPFLAALCIALLAALVVCLISRHRIQSRLQSCLDGHCEVVAQQSEHQSETTRQLLDSLQVGIFLVSADGRINWVNKKALELFGDRNLQDHTLEEAFVSSPLIDAARDALKSGAALTRQISLPLSSLSGQLTEDPNETHWIVEITPVASQSSPSQFLIALRDISKNVRNNQIRKDFVANASHELRTPLTIIAGYLENLLEDDVLSDPDTSKHMLGIMRKHVERINRIVEDMLVISRLESGEASALKISPFSVEECINDVIKRLEALIERQGAKVTIDISNPDLVLEGDRFYWMQILFNLVENSLKQNASSPIDITIKAREAGKDQLRLEVTDNGIGIPSSDLPFIFKRFFRVEKHHNQGEIKGTGLGLSIVKRAVEAHGGTISASSTPGVKTRFTMLTPLTQPN